LSVKEALNVKEYLQELAKDPGTFIAKTKNQQEPKHSKNKKTNKGTQISR